MLTWKFAGALILALLMIFGRVEDIYAKRLNDKEWSIKAKELIAKGQDVEIIKSDDITPEKYPEEFLKRFKKETRKEYFDQRIMIKKIMRGIMIEKRYKEKGLQIFHRQSINPNYHISTDIPSPHFKTYYSASAFLYIYFNREHFCLPAAALKNICKEGKRKCFYERNTIGFSTETDFLEFYYDEKDNAQCIKALEFYE